MPLIRSVKICLALLPVSVLVVGQLLADQTTEIRKLYRQVNQEIKSSLTKKVSLHMNDNPSDMNWYVSNPGDKNPDYVQSSNRAKVYLKEGRVRKAVFTSKSESGDWKSVEEYYFYENQNTAFYFQELTTYQGYDTANDAELPEGPYILEKRIYYSDTGKPIRELKKAFVKSSQQKIPVESLRELPFDMFPSAGKLPFAQALGLSK